MHPISIIQSERAWLQRFIRFCMFPLDILKLHFGFFATIAALAMRGREMHKSSKKIQNFIVVSLLLLLPPRAALAFMMYFS